MLLNNPAHVVDSNKFDKILILLYKKKKKKKAKEEEKQ